MHLSDDGKILNSVTDADIHEGRIIIPGSVTTIGVGAFRNCTGLTKLTIPEGVNSIGNDAFGFCTDLTALDFAGVGTTLGNNAFYCCTGLRELSIPLGFVIGDHAFCYCTGLTALRFAGGATVIGNNAFFGCTGLSELIIPKGVVIRNGTFSDCTGLTKLSIPEGFVIGEYAFSDCTGLTKLSIPKDVVIGPNAFSGCAGLTALRFAEGDTKIGNNAFNGCTGVTELSIPKGVVISNWTFSHCTRLTKLSIPEGFVIGDGSFYYCIGLRNILVNSNSGEELSRIKGLFTEQHPQAQVISLSLQNLLMRAYQRIINDPMASILFGIHSHMGLPDDLLPIIGFQEGDANRAYLLFDKSVEAIPLPVNVPELVNYEANLNAISDQIKRLRIAEQAKQIVQLQIMDSVAKLNGYVSCVKKLMAVKSTRYPGFFDTDTKLRNELEFKLQAVDKVIAYLLGDKEVKFSTNDLDKLRAGITGEILSKFKINLESLPIENAQEFGAICERRF